MLVPQATTCGRAVASPGEAKQRSRSDGCFAGGGRACPGRGPFPRGGRWPAGAGGGRWKRRAAERLCVRAGWRTVERARAARSGAQLPEAGRTASVGWSVP